MEPGKLIGTGTRAEIYDVNGKAFKLYHADVSKQIAFYEANVSSLMEQYFLGAPAIYEVTRLEDRWALVMELIRGDNFGDLLKNDPANAPAVMEELVDHQLRMHAIDGHLPLDLQDRLRSAITAVPVDEALRRNLSERLLSLHGERKLCHGDFHPYNLMRTTSGVRILDWMDASNGVPEADACRTWLILTLNYADWEGALPRLYLETYSRMSGKPEADILVWLPIVACDRLRENFPGEREQLMEWIQAI